jgi:hypothetical protein
VLTFLQPAIWIRMTLDIALLAGIIASFRHAALTGSPSMYGWVAPDNLNVSCTA